MARGGTCLSVERQHGPRVDGILRAEARCLMNPEWPEGEEFLVAGHEVRFAKDVRSHGDRLVFGTNQRQDRPPRQSVAAAQVEEGVEIIVRDHVPLSRLTIEWKQEEEDFVAQQAVLESAVEWQQRSVVQIGIGRTLLKVKWEDRETVLGMLILRGTAGETQELE